jgi:acetyl esterase/lipase
MKNIYLIIIVFLSIFKSYSQSVNPLMKSFPQGTILHGNIPYNNDTLKKHLLDIYLPANVKEKLPLVILVHGGGWWVNDKYADLGYMKNTTTDLINN